MLVVAALNGGRSPADHPAMPVSPAQLAAAAAEAARAGAGAVHFHVRGAGRAGEPGRGRRRPRGRRGAPRWACRSASAPAPGSSPTRPRRLAAVGEWTALPDFVSINFDEEGAAELATFFLGRGVALEAGVANPFAAEQLVRSGLGGPVPPHHVRAPGAGRRPRRMATVARSGGRPRRGGRAGAEAAPRRGRDRVAAGGRGGRARLCHPDRLRGHAHPARRRRSPAATASWCGAGAAGAWARRQLVTLSAVRGRTPRQHPSLRSG